MGLLSFFQLDYLIEQYHAPVLVETGTGAGNSLRYARQFPFEQIYSIEIVIDQVEKLQPAFAFDPRIHIIAGQSVPTLQEILPRINSNIIFWLDAHYPGADLHMVGYDAATNLAGPDVVLPLEREMRLIRDLRRGFADVILIDDLRVYEEDDFGEGNLSAMNLRHVGKFNTDFLYTVFADTHEPHRYLDHTGYLMLLPKVPAQ